MPTTKTYYINLISNDGSDDEVLASFEVTLDETGDPARIKVSNFTITDDSYESAIENAIVYAIQTISEGVN